MEEKSLGAFLNQNNTYPFHMPGHKRNADLDFLRGAGTTYDITEIHGADNLHDASGVLLSLMERAANLWGTDQSRVLVNGSTCGILAAMGTLAKRGDKVLVSRNCHKSVYHGLELFGLRPVFITPDFVEPLGVYGALSTAAVAKALAENADAVLLIAVSPTYEGFVSDMRSICALCHNAGVAVLADEAHGAHLDLSSHFTGGAVKAGADITVQSLHKTLPALTQTAILHVKGNRVDVSRLSHMLAVFQSSSPSYLLMRSAECAVQYAEDVRLFDRWAHMIEDFKKRVAQLKDIRLYTAAHMDPSKLVITGKDGILLGEHLRSHGVEAEYATHSFVLAMTGMGDSPEGFEALAAALYSADTVLPRSLPENRQPDYCMGELCVDMESALSADLEAVDKESAVGRVSAGYIWAYPPGIPLLLPGQRITEAFAASDLAACSGDRAKPPLVAVIKE